MRVYSYVPVALAALAAAALLPRSGDQIDPAFTVQDAAMVAAIEEHEVPPPATEAPRLVPTPAPRADGCPAVIVETFGARANEACAVALCESGYREDARGDWNEAKQQHQSLGYLQLWRGWAAWMGIEDAEMLLDGQTNARTALAVLEHRGRWGGAGGWTCADKLGIY